MLESLVSARMCLCVPAVVMLSAQLLLVLLSQNHL